MTFLGKDQVDDTVQSVTSPVQSFNGSDKSSRDVIIEKEQSFISQVVLQHAQGSRVKECWGLNIPVGWRMSVSSSRGGAVGRVLTVQYFGLVRMVVQYSVIMAGRQRPVFPL